MKHVHETCPLPLLHPPRCENPRVPPAGSLGGKGRRLGQASLPPSPGASPRPPHFSLQSLVPPPRQLGECLLQQVLLLQAQGPLQQQHVGPLLQLGRSQLLQLLLMLPDLPVLALGQWERLGRRAHLQVSNSQVDIPVLAQDVLEEFVVADEGVVDVVTQGQQVGGVELPLVISELVPQDCHSLSDGAACGHRRAG